MVCFIFILKISKKNDRLTRLFLIRFCLYFLSWSKFRKMSEKNFFLNKQFWKQSLFLLFAIFGPAIFGPRKKIYWGKKTKNGMPITNSRESMWRQLEKDGAEGKPSWLKVWTLDIRNTNLVNANLQYQHST